MTDREEALLKAIHSGTDPAILMELAIKEIVARLPPEQSLQPPPADLLAAAGTNQ